jgi:hypothetical protein
LLSGDETELDCMVDEGIEASSSSFKFNNG